MSDPVSDEASASATMIRFKHAHLGMVAVALALALVGLLAGFLQSILLWRRDGHPLGLVIFLMVVVLGACVAFRPLRMMWRMGK